MVNGTAREGKKVVYKTSSTEREAWVGNVVIDGVTYQWIDIIDEIDHLEIVARLIENANDYPIEYVIDQNSAKITTKAACQNEDVATIDMSAYFVLKSGQRRDLDYLLNNKFITSASINVTFTVSFSTDGRYSFSVLGNYFDLGYLYDYYTTTKDTPITRSWESWVGICGRNNYAKLKFNSAKINGKTFPIVVTNEIS